MPSIPAILGARIVITLWLANIVFMLATVIFLGVGVETVIVLTLQLFYSMSWFLHRSGRALIGNFLALLSLAWGGFMAMNIVKPEIQTSQLLVLASVLSFVLFSWRENKLAIIAILFVCVVFISVSIAFNFNAFGLQIETTDLIFSVFYPIFHATTIGIIAVAFYFFVRLLDKNVEELKRFAQKADELTEIKSRFLSNMSHEIRTPINGILGVLQVLRNDKDLPESRQRLLDVALYSSRQLNNIVNDILDVEKLESGQVRLVRAPFDMVKMVHDLHALFSAEANTKGITWRVEIDKSMPSKLMGDQTKIFQILNNVIGNAIKFTLEGEVKLNVSHRENTLYFVVSDTGVGMSESTQSVLFTRFAQGDDSLSKAFQGTGLGMSITKDFVELMGGNIEVFSEVNVGSTFTITLPLEKEEKPVVPHTYIKPVEVDFSHYKILIVEDNPLNLDVCLTLLRSSGAKLLVSDSGQKAIDLLRHVKVDLLLTDISMPIVSGEALIAEAKKIDPDICAIAMTGNLAPENLDRYAQLGFVEVLSKPLSRDRLLRTLDKYLSQSTSDHPA